MKDIKDLLFQWIRAVIICTLLAFLIGAVEQYGGSDMARAGGFCCST
ncbi:hypothetical protein [Paraburkholderia bannensis]|nr:hypothetical protein [Paraburkholderia bannensis]